MQRIMCYAKIHGATVTEANLQYVGSVTIDKALLDEAGIFPSEKVQIVNLHNGSRVETYAMEGEPGSGTVCMNGAAARWAAVGDKVLIIAYGLYEHETAQSLKPKIIFVDEKNRIASKKG